MPICDKLKNGTAFTEKGVTYCKIPRGECKHNNEGHKIEYNGENPKLRGHIFILCPRGGMYGTQQKNENPDTRTSYS